MISAKMMAGSVIGEVPTIAIKLLFVTYLLLPEDTYPNYAPVDIPSRNLRQTFFGQVTCYTDSGT
ncbi:pH-regulated antigen PRA1 [Candida albicans 19F]|nr:pH-regulated antigen PRA1 [Candida albicans 19F]